SGGVQVVPTAADVATATVSILVGSGVVSTASPTIPTTALIFTTATKSTLYTRRKGKETMVKSKTPKKKKIARDAEIARIHAKEELQMPIDGLDRNNETVAKYLHEYHQFAIELPIERRIELISDLTIVATSITEVVYVTAVSCCGQVLWIQNQLLDYGLSMPCKALSREISTSILCLCLTIDARLHTAKTFDLVWMWLGGDYGNVFLMGFSG
nr:uncharacterized mitochondrial protein AtMg00810-like [Tanacetum cinerariifolium]